MAKNSAMKHYVEDILNNPLLKNKALGNLDICYYSDIEEKPTVAIPTGCPEIDYQLLGPELGGFPVGRIVELFGPESGGKSTIGLKVIAQAQKMGYPCLLCDVERSYGDGPGREWLRKIGIDLSPNGLLYSREIIAEKIFQLVHVAFKAGVKVIMIDSIAAMVPKKESIEELSASSSSTDKKKANYGAEHMALLSRMLTPALRQMNGIVSDNEGLLICINQVRDFLGYNPTGINLLVRPGGHAFKHYASLSLKVQRAQTIKEGTLIVGNWAKIKVEKCKVGPAYGRETGKDTPNHVPIYYDGRTVNMLDSILPIAVELGIVNKPTIKSYSYKDINKVGKDNFIEAVKEAGYEDEIMEATTKAKGTYTSNDIDDLNIIDDDELEESSNFTFKEEAE